MATAVKTPHCCFWAAQFFFIFWREVLKNYRLFLHFDVWYKSQCSHSLEHGYNEDLLTFKHTAFIWIANVYVHNKYFVDECWLGCYTWCFLSLTVWLSARGRVMKRLICPGHLRAKFGSALPLTLTVHDLCRTCCIRTATPLVGEQRHLQVNVTITHWVLIKCK